MVSWHPVLNHAGCDTGGHEVVGAGQQNDVAAAIFQVIDQFFLSRIFAVAPVQGDEDHILERDTAAGHGDLHRADSRHQIDVVNPPPDPVQKLLGRYV